MINNLIKELDKIFSEYIRLKYSNNFFFCKCCTCSEYDHYKDMDAGHYIPRIHKSLRFSEYNVHVQCKQCNQFKKGNVDKYKEFLIKTYGPLIIDKLEQERNQIKKYTEYELQELIDSYKIKVETLKKQKHDT